MSNFQNRTLVFASNASMDLYPDNKPFNFKTRLPRPLELDGEWEVAILKIDYINDWKIIQKAAQFEMVMFYKDDTGTYASTPFPQTTYTFSNYQTCDYFGTELTPDYYNNVKEIIDKFNEFKYLKFASLERITGYDAEDKPTDEANFNKPKKLDFYTGKDFAKKNFLHNNEKFTKLHFLNGIHRGILYAKNEPAIDIVNLLGFKFDDEKEHSLIIPADSKYMPTVNKYPFVFVYTDIIEPDAVGDYCVPLLDEFPVKGKIGENAHWDFHVPNYRRVNKRYISTIELQLSTHSGELFPINSGPSLITLRFRKCGTV